MSKKDKIVRVNESVFNALKSLTQEDVFFDNDGNAKRVHNPMPSAFMQLSDKQLLSVYFYTILKMTYSADDFNMFLVMNPPGFDKYLIDVLEQKLSPNQSVIIPAHKIDDLINMQLELTGRFTEFQDYQVRENKANRLFLVRNFQFLKRGLSTLIGTIMESFNLSDRKTYINDKSNDVYTVLTDFGNLSAEQISKHKSSTEEGDH